MSQLLSPRREVGEFRKRYKWMGLVVFLVFGGLIAWMAVLQIAQGGEWQAAARENITRTIRLPATRGIVRDVRGRVIAENRPSYVVYVTPQLLQEGDRTRIEELMGLDDEARVAFRARLDAVPARRRTHQIPVFRDIDRDQLAALETHSIDLPALDVVARPLRTYPYGVLGAHAVGYLNEVSAEDLERLAEEGREGYGAGRSHRPDGTRERLPGGAEGPAGLPSRARRCARAPAGWRASHGPHGRRGSAPGARP